MCGIKYSEKTDRIWASIGGVDILVGTMNQEQGLTREEKFQLANLIANHLLKGKLDNDTYNFNIMGVVVPVKRSSSTVLRCLEGVPVLSNSHRP